MTNENLNKGEIHRVFNYKAQKWLIKYIVCRMEG